MDNPTPNSNKDNLSSREAQKEKQRFHVEQWKRSGMTMTDYCIENGINISSLSTWAKSCKKSKLFKPLVAETTKIERHAPVIEMLFGEGLRLRLVNVRDAALVIRIAKSLLCN